MKVDQPRIELQLDVLRDAMSYMHRQGFNTEKVEKEFKDVVEGFSTVKKQAPEAAELEELTARTEDPLIAQVAQQLQQRLSRESDPDSDEASVIRAALCELFHFATTR